MAGGGAGGCPGDGEDGEDGDKVCARRRASQRRRGEGAGGGGGCWQGRGNKCSPRTSKEARVARAA